MNNKQRKLAFIRYKNISKKYFPYPKWKLKRCHSWLCKWENTQPSFLEEKWILVSYERGLDK